VLPSSKKRHQKVEMKRRDRGQRGEVAGAVAGAGYLVPVGLKPL
jgi:hypothetical protein